MIARAVFAAAAAMLLLPVQALAQKMCDQVRTNITTAPAAITEKVIGKPNQRIYLCGYMIVRTSAQGRAGFAVRGVVGTRVNCAVGKELILPKMALPASGILVNRIAYTAEKTAPGHSVCLEVFGTGVSLVSSFYWTQF